VQKQAYQNKRREDLNLCSARGNSRRSPSGDVSLMMKRHMASLTARLAGIDERVGGQLILQLLQAARKRERGSDSSQAIVPTQTLG
jgi:hypothetical protein